MSCFVDEKDDSPVLCLLDSRTSCTVPSELFSTQKAKITKCCPSFHEGRHFAQEIHLAPIQNPLCVIAIPYEGHQQSWLDLPECGFQIIVTKAWRKQTVSRPLRSQGSPWERLLAESEVGKICIKYDVLDQPLLPSRLSPLFLRESGW